MVYYHDYIAQYSCTRSVSGTQIDTFSLIFISARQTISYQYFVESLTSLLKHERKMPLVFWYFER